MGAMAAAPDVVVLLPVVVVVVAALVSTATCVVSAGFFSPPAQAPSAIAPTATANPLNRIFLRPPEPDCSALPRADSLAARVCEFIHKLANMQSLQHPSPLMI